ncbi:MAG: stage V sporulation protein AB [Bacillota bacterium]
MAEILLILIGFAEGLVVGAALVAFLLVLNIIPRLIRFGSSKKYINLYQNLVIAGVLVAVNWQFYDLQLPKVYFINILLTIIIGFVFGIFVGLLAAALTETLKVLPILSRRMRLEKQIKILLLAIILGKVVGSLIYWLYPGLWPQ